MKRIAGRLWLLGVLDTVGWLDSALEINSLPSLLCWWDGILKIEGRCVGLWCLEVVGICRSAFHWRADFHFDPSACRLQNFTHLFLYLLRIIG